MSEKLYEYMMNEYENTSYEDRCKIHIEKTCRCCRYREDCKKDLPQDVWKPVSSNKSRIPARKSCEEFKWS